MGLLSKILMANLTTRAVKRLNAGARDPQPGPYTAQRAPRQQYIPARPTLRDKCVGFCRDNPKTLAALGALVAAAAVQQAMRRR